jgi:hypothetical protein
LLAPSRIQPFSFFIKEKALLYFPLKLNSDDIKKDFDRWFRSALSSILQLLFLAVRQARPEALYDIHDYVQNSQVGRGDRIHSCIVNNRNQVNRDKHHDTERKEASDADKMQNLLLRLLLPTRGKERLSVGTCSSA